MARKAKGSGSTTTIAPDDGAEAPTFLDSKPTDETAQDVSLVPDDDRDEREERAERDGPGTRSDDRGDGQTSGRRKDTPEQEEQNLKAALREERRRSRQALEDLDRERARASTEERRRMAAEEDAARAKRLEDLDEKPLSEAIGVIRDEVVGPAVQRARVDHVRLSQKVARLTYKDYDEVLKKSGVEDEITLDASGRAKDPVMWKRLLVDAEDPGEEAYLIGKEILRQRGQRAGGLDEEEGELLDEPAGDRATGRREVVERLERNGDRPRGIRDIPDAGAPATTRRFTRTQIDRLSEAERSRLPANVIDEWLMGRP